MLTVEYDANRGSAIRDGEVENFVSNIIEFRTESDHWVVVANELAVEAFRAAIVRGKISHENIRFVFKGQDLKVNSNAGLANWPKGYCDHSQNYIMEITKSRRKKNDNA